MHIPATAEPAETTNSGPAARGAPPTADRTTTTQRGRPRPPRDDPPDRAVLAGDLAAATHRPGSVPGESAGCAVPAGDPAVATHRPSAVSGESAGRAVPAGDPAVATRRPGSASVESVAGDPAAECGSAVAGRPGAVSGEPVGRAALASGPAAATHLPRAAWAGSAAESVASAAIHRPGSASVESVAGDPAAECGSAVAGRPGAAWGESAGRATLASDAATATHLPRAACGGSAAGCGASAATGHRGSASVESVAGDPAADCGSAVSAWPGSVPGESAGRAVLVSGPAASIHRPRAAWGGSSAECVASATGRPGAVRVAQLFVVGAGLTGVASGGWLPGWLGVVVFALAGAVVGAAGRLVLGRMRIACHPPWCELAGAVLSAAVGWRCIDGSLPSWWLPIPLLLGWLAVPLGSADLICRRLPDTLTLAAYPAIGLAVGLSDPAAGLRALAGAAVFGGTHLVVRALAPGAMGGGDVKLAGGLGIVLGALGWADVALAATLAAVGTLLLAVATRSRTAPHGPGLLAATWLLAAFAHT